MLIAILQQLSDFSESHPWWTSILTVLITAHVSKWIKGRRFRLPPGPVGLPFVGCLPFLGSNPQREITKLQQTYGNVFSLSLGSRSAVVLGDYKAIKEANEKPSFLGNIKGLFRLSDKVQHFSEMPFSTWKESYGFTVTALEKLSEGKNALETFIQHELKVLCDKLQSSTGRTEVNLRNFLTPVLTRTFTFAICGKDITKNPDFTSGVENYAQDSWSRIRTKMTTMFLPLVGLFLPDLNPSLNPRLKDVKRNSSEIILIMKKEVDNHEKKVEGSPADDYMDYFISEMKRILGDPGTFTKKVLTGNSLLLLNSSIEVTSSQAQWIFLLLAKYSEIQEQVHKEIVQAFGTETAPSWSDRQKLPYLQAVIKEALRIKTVAPLGTPHLVTSPSMLHYYDIPKDTIVIQNLQTVHMDPSLWDDPEDFKPERFLSKDGSTVQEPDYFMPFSYGKRTCPGASLAQMQLFLLVASVLQTFKILPPLSGLNLDEKISHILSPTSPFVKIQSRELATKTVLSS